MSQQIVTSATARILSETKTAAFILTQGGLMKLFQFAVSNDGHVYAESREEATSLIELYALTRPSTIQLIEMNPVELYNSMTDTSPVIGSDRTLGDLANEALNKKVANEVLNKK
jgi:hypothetical protein